MNPHHYHTMIRGQVEFDRFVDGLNTCSLLDMICKNQKIAQATIICDTRVTPE